MNKSWELMSKKQALEYLTDNHKGKTITQVQHSNRSAYRVFRKKGYIEAAVNNGILTKIIAHIWEHMSKKQALEYLTDNHKGKTINEFVNEESGAYFVFHKKGYIEAATENKILIRGGTPRGTYANMSKKQALEYLTDNHKGKTLSELSKENDGAYRAFHKKGYIDLAVEKGILIRERDSVLHRTKRNLDFIAKDESANKLATSYLILDEKEPELTREIEQMILELHPEKFKDTKEIRYLLLGNQKVLEKSITNLGPYLGEYTLEEKQIFPVFLGDVFNSIKEMSSGIEERIFRAYRAKYSPIFNQNPEKTIDGINDKITNKKTNMNKIYKKLAEYYKQMSKLGDELN
jgi:hypothetical protein